MSKSSYCSSLSNEHHAAPRPARRSGMSNHCRSRSDTMQASTRRTRLVPRHRPDQALMLPLRQKTFAIIALAVPITDNNGTQSQGQEEEAACECQPVTWKRSSQASAVSPLLLPRLPAIMVRAALMSTVTLAVAALAPCKTVQYKIYWANRPS